MQITTSHDDHAKALDVKDLDFLQHLSEIAPLPASPSRGASPASASVSVSAAPSSSASPSPPGRAPRPIQASSVSLQAHEPDWSGLVAALSPPDPLTAAHVVEKAAKHKPIEAGHTTGTPLRNTRSRRLVVTKQPASEFYKDEGGKSNALDVEVTLVEFDEHGEPMRSRDDEFVDIPLRILLFFESGKRVDDTDQEIFRFVGNEYDSVVIRAATRKTSVQFRLEKVSRRKDGQRFKLRIEVDQEQCTANVADLTPIFTNAICVLSKRKHHAPVVDTSSRSVREPPLKLLKRDLGKIEEKLDERMNGLMAEISRVNKQLQMQSELISKLLMPVAQPVPSTPLQASSEGAAMEWFLRSGVVEEVMFKTAHFPTTTLTTAQQSYLTDSDDVDEQEERSSPTSSDASVVEIPSLSNVTFSDF